MDSTPNLQLPYLIAAQAQKHVTHNEALRALDAVVQLLVLDKDLATPPGSPADGSRYIVAASPTGAWTGNADHIAAWQDGAWAFYAPREGWLAWVADEDKLYAFSGSAWVEFTAPGVGAPLFGINATADTTNRLAVKSTASLFDNVGNGHQKKINKAAAGDTASTLYQTGYSGRAEHGLTGDDNFHVKVSPDGSTWYEAMIVDRSTGNVGFGTAPTARMTVSNNVTAPPSVGSTSLFHFVGADAVNPSYVFDAFAGFHVLTARRANGTNASKSALAADDAIFQFNANGYNGSAYSNARARIRLFAGEAWSGSAQGTYVTIDTTANGGTSIAEKVRVTGDGKVGIGTTAPSNKLGIEGIAAPETDNSYTLGTASKRWSEVYAATGTINTSDARLKTEVADSALGLGFVCALRPRSFKWLEGGRGVEWDEETYEEQEQATDQVAGIGTEIDIVDGQAVVRQVPTMHEVPLFDELPMVDAQGTPILLAKEDGSLVQATHRVPRMRTVQYTRPVKREVAKAGVRTHYGFVAQEVKAALDEAGVGDFAGWVLSDKNDPGSTQGLRTDQFIAPLIKAVQELAARVAALEANH